MHKQKISSDPSPHSMLMAQTMVRATKGKTETPVFVVEAWNADDVDWEEFFIKSSIYIVDAEGLALLRAEYDTVFIPDTKE